MSADDSALKRWTCPRCDREFGHANQSHVCVPAQTIDVTFAGRPTEFRVIADTVVAFLESLGPVHVDAGEVGVFVKRVRTVVEIRPQARAVTLWIVNDRFVDDSRVSRHVRASSTRFVNVVKTTTAEEVDDQVRAWLVEAFDAAG